MENKEKIDRIESCIASILSALGEVETESNKDTPKRIAKMLTNELFSSINNEGIHKLEEQMKLFKNDNAKNTPVTVTVPFYSMCEHHWLPFFGSATIEYVPDKHIIGLSKIPRVVKFFSRKPQLQERLTSEIGEFLFNYLKPKYLNVELKAHHLCVEMRGVNSPCETTTKWTGGGKENEK